MKSSYFVGMNKTENPWKTLSSKVVYSNPWITVREDAVITPSGTEGIYGVVEPRIATGVVALTETNEVYLVGQYRYATNIYSWELPEGGAELNEDPLTAIKRELKEEAGIIADNWKQLGSEIHLSNSFTNERAFLYMATGLHSVQNDPDDTEILQVKKVPFQDALKMIDSGEILDAMTMLGLYRAAIK